MTKYLSQVLVGAALRREELAAQLVLVATVEVASVQTAEGAAAWVVVEMAAAAQAAAEVVAAE